MASNDKVYFMSRPIRVDYKVGVCRWLFLLLNTIFIDIISCWSCLSLGPILNNWFISPCLPLSFSLSISTRIMSVEQERTTRDHPKPPYPLHDSVVNRINPEYAAFYNTHIFKQQQVHLQPVEASRTSGTLIPGGGPLAPVAKTVDYSIPRQETIGPDIKIRAFTPNGVIPDDGWPVCIYFHGGGWVLGTIDTENVIATNLCDRGRSVVVAVDYRLAPEHPYPAAVDDCWESLLWVLGQGKEILQLDTTKLATGGSSAGANIAAIMCQRAAVRGGPKFLLQLLSVPVTDNTADTSNNGSWRENEHVPALPASKMMWYRKHYLPNISDWSHPEASPLLWKGDWSKLPYAVIVVGELDVLRDEGLQFGNQLHQAGVKANVHVMKGQPHPFIAMDGVLEAGKQAITYFCDALVRTMYPEACLE
ncbi:alpha/beta hydrolase fold-domain-containing protein [Whalleya microplaca]|nr:alpha/beta hydrolase fold-domain-containing protein [Whalleya microplaca]